MRDFAEGVVYEDAKGLALDYALAFLNAVNWDEIARAYTEDEAVIAFG